MDTKWTSNRIIKYKKPRIQPLKLVYTSLSNISRNIILPHTQVSSPTKYLNLFPIKVSKPIIP